MTAYDSHPIIPAKSLDEMPELEAALEEFISQKRGANLRHLKRKKHHLSNLASWIRTAIADHPWAPSAFLWKQRQEKVSFNVQESTRKELEDAGIVMTEQSRVGSANRLLYQLTPKGYESINRNPQKNLGRGSITHQHISHWIAMHYEKKGCMCWCEWMAPGTNHAVDCAVEIATNEFVAYEVVVTATDNILHHISVLSEVDVVRTITLVFTQKKKLEHIRKHLTLEPIVKNLGQNLRFELAESYLRSCFP